MIPHLETWVMLVNRLLQTLRLKSNWATGEGAQIQITNLNFCELLVVIASKKLSVTYTHLIFRVSFSTMNLPTSPPLTSTLVMLSLQGCVGLLRLISFNDTICGVALDIMPDIMSTGNASYAHCSVAMSSIAPDLKPKCITSVLMPKLQFPELITVECQYQV